MVQVLNREDTTIDIHCNEYPLIGEKIFSQKLSNGLTVFVVPKHGFQKCCAFFATDYGGADRRFKLAENWIDTPAGVAHFLEHKMFDIEGGENALTVLSANGASPNAYTSTDITAYHFECTEKFTENLELLLSFVSTPYFTSESVEKEQGIIGQEILMIEDDPDYCLYYGLMMSLFKHSPIRDSVAGTVESIAEITADTLYGCHKVFYNPSNMALCIVGDINPQLVFDIAEKILPKEKGEVPKRDYGAPEELSPNVVRFEKSMEVSLPMFLGGCKSTPPLCGRSRLKLFLVSSLALEVLAGHSSPLFFSLYGQGLVNTDFSASFDAAVGSAYTIFGGETREPQRVFDEVVKEICRLTEKGPDPRFFNRLKKAAVGGYVRSLNSFGSICGAAIEGHFRGFDVFESPEILSSITEDDITTFYRDHLNPANMAIAIITPQ